MPNLEMERKISAVAESLEIMGFKLLAEFARLAEGDEIIGYAEIAKLEAERQKEFFIAEKMRFI